MAFTKDKTGLVVSLQEQAIVNREDHLSIKRKMGSEGGYWIVIDGVPRTPQQISA